MLPGISLKTDQIIHRVFTCIGIYQFKLEIIFFCLNSFEETINYIVKGQGGKTRNLVMTLKALVGF